MSEAEQAMLFEWTGTTVDEAVIAGLIAPPWRPTAEAAHAAFGTKH